MKKIKVYFVCTHLPNCNFQIKICNFSYGPKAIYLHDHSILVSFSLNQETRSLLVLIKMALFWIFLTHYYEKVASSLLHYDLWFNEPEPTLIG